LNRSTLRFERPSRKRFDTAGSNTSVRSIHDKCLSVAGFLLIRRVKIIVPTGYGLRSRFSDPFTPLASALLNLRPSLSRRLSHLYPIVSPVSIPSSLPSLSRCLSHLYPVVSSSPSLSRRFFLLSLPCHSHEGLPHRFRITHFSYWRTGHLLLFLPRVSAFYCIHPCESSQSSTS